MRSVKFLFNARHSTEEGARKIEAARSVARSVNAQAREAGSPERVRVVVSPRKGRSNPNAWKYENRHMAGKRWRVEDAESVDVYLVRRA